MLALTVDILKPLNSSPANPELRRKKGQTSAPFQKREQQFHFFQHIKDMKPSTKTILKCNIFSILV